MKLKTKDKDKDVYIVTGVAGFIGSTLLPALIKKKSQKDYPNLNVLILVLVTLGQN